MMVEPALGQHFNKPRADLRRAEVSGRDLRRLASYQDLKITADQQYRLLEAMGVDVQPD